jgi:hypothetical protein
MPCIHQDTGGFFVALLRKRKELPDATATAAAAAAAAAAGTTTAPPGGAAPRRPATGPASSRELPELEAEDAMAPLAAAEAHAPSPL